MSTYHSPVMLSECIEGLRIKPDGVYIDLTFGGGGHSKAILAELNEKGKLYGFDQDADAEQEASQITAKNFTLMPYNFRYFYKYLRMFGVEKVDGILADLGISSHQIDTPARGFSTRFEGFLDMRMNQNAELTAAKVLNHYTESELHKIFGLYGEIKNAKTLAQAVIRERIKNPFETCQQLCNFLDKYAPFKKEFKYFAQVFQALRIVVNDEMLALEEMLSQTEFALKKTGRLVVMSYHSLEDRLVKNYIQKGKFSGEAEKDFYGNLLVPFENITKKIIIPTAEEIEANPRARSAKLRIAEKI
ncbi:MAG: 16S rRNA (cytosine(1402)-N(4))-methyltransferase RsmH [Bacteroidetes bacterium]|nr:MAG: 16S rRNA (cytosine(1402)-N(4))-methyltransferase RsmH [Bacteroidota bacterium]TAG87459.1 MAG: 16S rRNA (cytosine(1402)-N(4))-methyltransferase RsmH [Bacteroidota bacterium]